MQYATQECVVGDVIWGNNRKCVKVQSQRAAPNPWAPERHRRRRLRCRLGNQWKLFLSLGRWFCFVFILKEPVCWKRLLVCLWDSRAFKTNRRGAMDKIINIGHLMDLSFPTSILRMTSVFWMLIFWKHFSNHIGQLNTIAPLSLGLSVQLHFQ